MDNRQIFCQHCGAANSQGARYCHSCGREVIAGPPPQQQIYAPPPPPPQQMYTPPPIQQVIVQQAPAQRKGSKTCLWIVGIMALLVVCCGVVAYQYYKFMMAPMQSVASDFLEYLQAQNYTQAYNLCGGDLQNELGSPDGLKSFIEGNGFTIKTWSISGVQRFEGTPTTGTASGQVTFTNGRNAKVTVHLATDNANIWKVIGIEFDL